MTAIVSARGLHKHYGSLRVLDGVDLNIEKGAIVGLIGPNGAGKTTLLKALLGLCRFEGELEVLGLDPRRQRHDLSRQICFIADVSVLPRWLKAGQALELVRDIHPLFDMDRARSYLDQTRIPMNKKVAHLSKGMITQLYLALVMAIDAPLLILDEPTLGLDILYRKKFYDHLIQDYHDRERTIIVTTHQVEEIETLLTHLLFLKDGKLVLNTSMASVADEYCELMVPKDRAQAGRDLGPIGEREVFGRKLFLYKGVERDVLGRLGELHTPGIVDLYLALMKEDAA
ncbi:ABC transporter ATP-binding protein [Sulfidibacter corallicola]|uniref:ABC transporter ATP-binding protein n=1 Tax=Sulfidibacter corallicola TaxID=2818388 RepID=A0A8A4TM13_SULCO|nr:ABC transporter ATP-binding protein [Sulfidibacter corallicola]QTD50603.1 ABC transporter ATP-binding protein [Sulfidibacter corallicola]